MRTLGRRDGNDVAFCSAPCHRFPRPPVGGPALAGRPSARPASAVSVAPVRPPALGHGACPWGLAHCSSPHRLPMGPRSLFVAPSVCFRSLDFGRGNGIGANDYFRSFGRGNGCDSYRVERFLVRCTLCVRRGKGSRDSYRVRAVPALVSGEAPSARGPTWRPAHCPFPHLAPSSLRGGGSAPPASARGASFLDPRPLRDAPESWRLAQCAAAGLRAPTVREARSAPTGTRDPAHWGLAQACPTLHCAKNH